MFAKNFKCYVKYSVSFHIIYEYLYFVFSPLKILNKLTNLLFLNLHWDCKHSSIFFINCRVRAVYTQKHTQLYSVILMNLELITELPIYGPYFSLYENRNGIAHIFFSRRISNSILVFASIVQSYVKRQKCTDLQSVDRY